MEKLIHAELKSDGSPVGVVVFSHEGKVIGAVDVLVAMEGTFDLAFRKFALAGNWSNVDPELRDMLLVYQREVADDTDYRQKTYRFLPTGDPWKSPWKLTTDKSDIHPEMLARLTA